MSTQELQKEAMALPLAERVSLAQALWENIDAGLADINEDAALRDAIRRDKELSDQSVMGRSLDDVMRAAHRAIGCDELTTPRRRWS